MLGTSEARVLIQRFQELARLVKRWQVVTASYSAADATADLDTPAWAEQEVLAGHSVRAAMCSILETLLIGGGPAVVQSKAELLEGLKETLTNGGQLSEDELEGLSERAAELVNAADSAEEAAAMRGILPGVAVAGPVDGSAVLDLFGSQAELLGTDSLPAFRSAIE